MKDSRGREPVVGQLPHSVPRQVMLLTAPPQRTQPDALDVVPERFQRLPVGRDGVIGEEAPDDLLKPSPLLGDWFMHTPSQLLLDGLELRPHSIAPGFPQDEELAPTVALTDEGEAQDVEGLRLAEPAPSTS